MKLAVACFLAFGSDKLVVGQSWLSANWFYEAPPECNEKISRHVKLEKDYTCDCTEKPAFTVEGNDNLVDLNGHYVSCDNTTDTESVTAGVAIRVEGKNNCIVGPGNVTEASHGIVLDGDGGHLLSRVSVYNTGSDGILVLADSNTIEKSSVELTLGVEYADGIQIEGDNNVVKGNVIHDTEDSAIDLFSNFNLIEDNHMFNTGYDVVEISGSGNRVLRNSMSGSLWSGIYVQDSENTEIRGNEIFENGVEVDPGILVESTNDNLLIVENHIFKNDGQGIYLDDDPQTSTNTVIERNIITDNDDDGIYCGQCEHCTFNQNTINNNVDRGIDVRDACDNSMISDNVVTANGDHGVKIYSGAASTVVTRNSLCGNKGSTSDYKNNAGASTIKVSDNTICVDTTPLDGSTNDDEDDEKERKPREDRRREH